jgi:hypothetical protein
MPKKTFHYRDLKTSAPLQRVYRLLMDGRSRTTRELNRGADVECGPTIVDELRRNGCDISCERKGSFGNYRWFYTMVKGVDWWDEIMGERRAA